MLVLVKGPESFVVRTELARYMDVNNSMSCSLKNKKNMLERKDDVLCFMLSRKGHSLLLLPRTVLVLVRAVLVLVPLLVLVLLHTRYSYCTVLMFEPFCWITELNHD